MAPPSCKEPLAQLQALVQAILDWVACGNRYDEASGLCTSFAEANHAFLTTIWAFSVRRGAARDARLQRAGATDDAPRPAVKSTAAERTKAFEWFSRLGYPDVKGRKYVRVATGHWFQAGNDPPTNTYQRGFVLAEEGDRFTVLTLSLAEPKYKRTPADTPGYKQVGYTATELKTGAAAYLRNLRKPPKEQQWDGVAGVLLDCTCVPRPLCWRGPAGGTA